ncbi:hypothetical protein M378DRAFT_162429 [Amanita muscaria Koide BX008]|uniref:Uncharacterized protein n=1 Tax=Amanita muscaria (strain Koide BX008) TaxID=946122 RepID=A0A0C2X788_AMAMK|nr:hypothetical protein M378DRAFT_162429 [Amanita muscaria Koide BX008]
MVSGNWYWEQKRGDECNTTKTSIYQRFVKHTNEVYLMEITTCALLLFPSRTMLCIKNRPA